MQLRVFNKYATIFKNGEQYISQMISKEKEVLCETLFAQNKTYGFRGVQTKEELWAVLLLRYLFTILWESGELSSTHDLQYSILVLKNATFTGYSKYF